MSVKRTVNIIGSGVGGLTLARALSQSNKFRVKVFERAPELNKDVGAGFSITTSSLILNRLGYDLSHLVHPTTTLVNYNHRKKLGESELFAHMKKNSKFSSLFDNMGGGVVRGELLQMIANGLPDDSIVVNKNLIDFQIENKGVVCKFEDGTEDYCDILIGADGIGSMVRRKLFGEQKPTFSNIGVWYGMAKLDTNSNSYKSIIGRAYQVHGPDGQFFIFYPCGHEGHVTIAQGFPMRTPMREDWGLEGAKEELQRISRDYNYEVVHDIVDNAIRLMKFGLFYREPCVTWHKGPVALLGDSVHAMLPFLGQGANQAIEDAYSLSKYLSDDSLSVQEAFAAYNQHRQPKTAKLVQAATTIGQFHTEARPIRVFMRENMIRFSHKTGMFKRTVAKQWDGMLQDFV